MGGHEFEAEAVHVPERLIVAPHAGVFRAPPGLDAIAGAGEVIERHQVLGTIERTRERFTVTSPHTGILMGLLVTAGERVRASQPLAWLRVATPSAGVRRREHVRWRDMAGSRDPRALHAPDAYEALCRLEADARARVAPDVLDPARRRVAMALGQEPWEPPGGDPVLAYTDQFVVDVTSAELAPLADRLGAEVGPFVQALWVLDLGMRTDLALAALFGAPCPPRDRAEPSEGFDASFDEFLQVVARLRALDPVTSELVRLRGARFHNCRLCRSLRTAAALREGADEAMFDKIDRYESSDLDERHKVALRLTDAVVTQPGSIDAALVGQVRAHFDDAQIVELALDVMRNAANKVAVAFGADEPNVTEGVELYDVLPDGNLVYGLTSVDG